MRVVASTFKSVSAPPTCANFGTFKRKSAAAGAFTLLSKLRSPNILPQRSMLHAAAIICSASGADVMELQLKVDGMVCDGCSSRVLEALQKIPNVTSVDVNLGKGIATIQIEASSQLDAFNWMPHLIEIIKDLGFEAAPHFDLEEEQQ